MKQLKPSELAVAIVVLGLGVVVAGAEVAAFVFGGHHRLADAGAALVVLVRLPSHLGVPAAGAAWRVGNLRWPEVDPEDRPAGPG